MVRGATGRRHGLVPPPTTGTDAAGMPALPANIEELDNDTLPAVHAIVGLYFEYFLSITTTDNKFCST